MAFVPEAALIALREGLEAFLIVGILLGFVTKLGRPDAKKWVWLGLATGILGSLLVGVLVQFFLLEPFEDQGGAAWFELVAALVAVGVLTYMVFWMWKHTRSLMVGLRQKIGEALSQNTLWVIALLTFASVIREGLEVVLFYGALAGRNSSVDLAWSGALGAILSVGLVVLILKTTVSFNLQKFFAATGLLLVFIAAGLLVHSVHAATDIGLLTHQDALWDTSRFVSDEGAPGRILHALTGYTAQPTLLQAVLYFGYLFGVGIPYLTSLGLFHRRPERGLRRVPVAVVAGVVLVASLATAWGATNPVEGVDGGHAASTHSDGSKVPHEVLLANATKALSAFSGKVGILIRDHGEQVSYNASTYETIKKFIRDLWPCTGLPSELLTIDDGSYFIDSKHPFDEQPHIDASLIDPWLKPWNLPAAPVADPLGTGTLKQFGVEGHYYFTPGVGPGQGEGDLFEIIGLGSYREWLKMNNHSPRYEQGQPSWTWLEYHLHKHFGNKVVVAFAHGVDPKMDPNETLESAARYLVQSGTSIVLDVYQSSIHSDAMNTHMMRPHAAHALHEAGFHGNVLSVGQAGLNPAWGDAVANRVEQLVQEVNQSLPLSIHLVQHGANPKAQSPCLSGPDQYHSNARAEFDVAAAAVKQRLAARGNFTIRHVYGQGAGAADDGVLSPTEALDLDRQAGARSVLMLPFEFWGDGVDTLVALRESLGYEPKQAPYYDSNFETRFTTNGIAIRIASAQFETERKSEALLDEIGMTLATLKPTG